MHLSVSTAKAAVVFADVPSKHSCMGAKFPKSQRV